MDSQINNELDEKLSSKDIDTNDKNDKDNKDDKKAVGFFQLFRYATPFDMFMMFLGTICAIANGAAVPFLAVIIGNALTALLHFTLLVSLNQDTDEAADILKKDILKQTKYFFAFGGGVVVVAYFQMAFWMIAGENQVKRLRQIFYKSILRQDIAFFESVSTGQITSRISSDATIFQDGISEKVGLVIQNIATFIGGFIIGFTKGWKLALVVSSSLPLLIVSSGLFAYLIEASTKKGQEVYAEAGTIAEQALSGIRTVTSFGGQQREIDRYNQKLQGAYVIGKKKAVTSGISFGLIYFSFFGTYSLAFWYGGTLVYKGTMNGGEVLNVIFAVVLGAFFLGSTGPSFAAIASARGAAYNLFNIMDRIPTIDSGSDAGTIIDKKSVKGRLEFKNIDFFYPSRPDVQILKNFNLTVEAGETVALVGSSGSGKSTIVGLLERFYDPTNGSILLDGQEIKNINVKSLRSQIGLVGQEPVLFPESIRQNVAWGCVSDDKEPNLDEVIEACKKSNADTFIKDLPKGYDTNVGDQGSLLSGGQKQRIAIARAIIKNPSILLLDEATSALDTESERLVQEALDKATASGSTTSIVIAHRLSTIKNADKIVVMAQGEILEIGSHEELIAKNGAYYALVQAQELKVKETKEETEESEISSESESEDEKDDDLVIELEGKEKKSFLRRISTKGSTTVASDEKDKRPNIHRLTTKDSEKKPNLRRMTTKDSEKKTNLRRMTTKDSVARSIEEMQEEEYKKKLKQPSPYSKILKHQKPEYIFIFFGLVGSILNGLIFPAFTIIFTSILNTFSKTNDPEKLRDEANFWALMFLVVAVVAFTTNFMQTFFFGFAGERLTMRLRTLTLTALLKQEMGFFDEEKNATGILTSKLASDASKVEGLTGASMGSILNSVTNVVAGLAIGFFYSWKLTLVVLVVMPLFVVASALQLQAMAGFGEKTREAYEASGEIVQQSVSNIRTIASLTLENTFLKRYQVAITSPHKIAIKGIMVSSAGFGFAQGALFFVYGLAFWYGGQLVARQENTLNQMLKAFFAILFSAMALGQISTFAPDTAKAKVSAISIVEILERKSLIDSTQNEGKDRPTPVTGQAKFQDVYFNYPARRNVKILRGLNLEIASGKTVALVGQSGSGKSTVISLLLRFYDAKSGNINLENVGVKNWNLEYLRNNMSFVEQEPTLFDVSIKENIAYGKSECTQEEIETAAKNANIHNFIVGLPKGYDTPVGQKGTQLSGGQKQRIAIARSLIRNPKLLLLDEATSALDSESEKLVQEAIDKASKNSTTVIIAHRLSTIQNADLILVVNKGKIAEQGSHFELVAQHGLYFELVNNQMLGPQH
ncbi:hypothetical protein Glove_99g187 [Diversispora epigaea]|uniref:Uncharacterized protein n=1 Tax=Diversispora epigaea TaxID=1348612 RepID=A0A397J712_9GLOM|nr:hypothetical protein Glove_99g187 [Diversispora epigaea]